MATDAQKAEEMRVRYLTEAIETSTPASRLTMLLDALDMALFRADRALGAEPRDIKAISDLLIHAQDILFTLRETLDVSAWEPAGHLQALYDFLYNELVTANLEKDRRRVVSVLAHVSQLAAAWRQAAQSTEGAAVELSGAK